MINDAVMSTAVRKAEERGVEQGIDQGIELGIERGIEQGIELGAEQGAETKAGEIALNLLKMGLSVEQIADSTGLTVEEIEEIRDNLL